MRQALLALDGVVTAEVSFDDERAQIRYRPDLVTPDQLAETVTAAGFPAEIADDGPES